MKTQHPKKSLQYITICTEKTLNITKNGSNYFFFFSTSLLYLFIKVYILQSLIACSSCSATTTSQSWSTCCYPCMTGLLIVTYRTETHLNRFKPTFCADTGWLMTTSLSGRLNYGMRLLYLLTSRPLLSCSALNTSQSCSTCCYPGMTVLLSPIENRRTWSTYKLY